MGQVSEGYSGSDISVVVSTSFLIVVRTYKIYNWILGIDKNLIFEI